jgi:hypothetical protein
MDNAATDTVDTTTQNEPHIEEEQNDCDVCYEKKPISQLYTCECVYKVCQPCIESIAAPRCAFCRRPNDVEKVRRFTQKSERRRLATEGVGSDADYRDDPYNLFFLLRSQSRTRMTEWAQLHIVAVDVAIAEREQQMLEEIAAMPVTTPDVPSPRLEPITLITMADVASAVAERMRMIFDEEFVIADN